MTFRIDRIEIQQQPERKRYWAEVEALTPSGFRRKRLETPDTDGYWGILNAIGAYCDEYAPKPSPPGYDDPMQATVLGNVPTGTLGADVLDGKVPLRAPDDAVLDTLRAEAEAAGVRVDRRWGEARLREEIASARPAAAALGDVWPSDEPGRE